MKSLKRILPFALILCMFVCLFSGTASAEGKKMVILYPPRIFQRLGCTGSTAEREPQTHPRLAGRTGSQTHPRTQAGPAGEIAISGEHD